MPTSFNASRSHSSGGNFIFLWGEQVRLFSYLRIESESTTTLVTKTTNTRLKQQTFQPTDTKKSLNLFFITLGAFHSPSGEGVAWFKEGKRGGGGGGAIQDGRFIMDNVKLVNQTKQSPNLHWAKQSYIYNAYFVHIGGLYAWICCLTTICRFPRKTMTDGWGSEVEWSDRHTWNRPLRKIP